MGWGVADADVGHRTYAIFKPYKIVAASVWLPLKYLKHPGYAGVLFKLTKGNDNERTTAYAA